MNYRKKKNSKSIGSKEEPNIVLTRNRSYT